MIPGEWPPHSFDLIIFSEFLYYFADADLDRVLRLGIGVATAEDRALVAALTANGSRSCAPARSPWSPRPDARAAPRAASANISLS